MKSNERKDRVKKSGVYLAGWIAPHMRRCPLSISNGNRSPYPWFSCHVQNPGIVEHIIWPATAAQNQQMVLI